MGIISFLFILDMFIETFIFYRIIQDRVHIASRPTLQEFGATVTASPENENVQSKRKEKNGA